MRHGMLEFRIIDDPTCDSVNQKHFTGLQTALLDDSLGVNSDGAHLGCTDDTVIVSYIETTRAQTVPVQVSTAVPSI